MDDRAKTTSVVLKIEKGVPIPARCHGSIMWGDMEVGDSVPVPLARLAVMSGGAYQYGLRHGREFTARKMDEFTGRIWRTA